MLKGSSRFGNYCLSSLRWCSSSLGYSWDRKLPFRLLITSLCCLGTFSTFKYSRYGLHCTAKTGCRISFPMTHTSQVGLLLQQVSYVVILCKYANIFQPTIHAFYEPVSLGEISDSHGGEYEDGCLLGCCAM
jgi:hypothetical protein